MSQQKQRIAKKLLALGIETFTGEKVNGKYIVGMVSFKSLKEIEAYIKELEMANAQQSAAETGVVEHKEKPMHQSYESEKAKEAQRIAALRRKDNKAMPTVLSDMTRDELIAEHNVLYNKGLRSGYEDRRIEEIEAELARRSRKHFEPERYERWT